MTDRWSVSICQAVFSESHGPAPFITKVFIVKPLPNCKVDNWFIFLHNRIPLFIDNLYLLIIAMAVVLTTRDQELLAHSSTTIAAIDQSKVKNKTIEDDSSKQYKASKQRQGH